MSLRDILIKIFRQDVGGVAIEMYNWVHILYLLIIVGSIAGMYFLFKNKGKEKQQLLLKINAIVLIGLYLTDFLVHPFMYGGEDLLIVDKLPYHICTLSAIMIAIINIFPNATKNIRVPVTIYGLIGAFYYVFIPSGVTGPDVMAFCYKEIQTFLYHGVLLGYGVLALLFEDIKPDFKKCWIDAIVVAVIILISLGANAAYSIPEGHQYDWFFTTGISFGLPKALMPFIIFGVFFGTDMVVYAICYLVKYLKNKKNNTLVQKAC